MKPGDIDVIASADDEQQVIDNTLADLGLTFDELAEEAETRNFSTVEARLAWLLIGELYYSRPIGGQAFGRDE
ncbi:hypothetical protein FDI59_gp111 [Mycobacterium phage Yoshi]|uniref:Uncharacterized protein n=4 Tax=Gracegardnervirinae TaxID=2946632 RepID=A0A2D1GAE4_9CAUD|nr:gp94 [Mycobacterium phage Pacc40]YP_009614015.1 hypothetical protein FDI59_gp111 [Mycobacterium phage Yoshi]YP_009957503.1 hypothetical protein I5H41_gp100 [Mycobacterium phage Galactic]YP_009963810.1 hypothetical protein I5I02_gp112 [Mycobacterium phage Demsculpinboyz]WNM74083.1 hypothetical protein SEA_LUNABLU_103 [Mycobacterium Phage LunaBlu]WNT44567.1 hypothetical protein SEA_BLUECRAB_99 [Mycobacterium phage BlueCrab]ACI12605.1 hypothetical protein PACC40_94 [Mycobacterium phage Pacc40